MVSYKGRSGLVIVGCVGAVEALKDQLGICRWNYGMRCIEQHAKNKLGSLTQSKKLSSHCNNSPWISSTSHQQEEVHEESFKKVMYLNCWGPN